MVITFISLIPILLGILLLIVAFKKLGNGYAPRRNLAKLIRKALGEKVTRVLAGIVGIGFIFYGITFFMDVNGINLTSAKEKKSNEVSITKINVTGWDTIISSILTPLNMLEHITKYPNKNFVSISFRNNYLKEIPDVVWEMVNLEEINLTNNEITTLPIEKVKNLRKLNTIILINNPISKSELMKVRNELDLKIITEK